MAVRIPCLGWWVATLVCGIGLVSVQADDSAKPADTASSKFELRDGDRVVFLGNTLIEREQKSGHWETTLTARYPDRNIVFRNLGWDGDTVWSDSRGIFDPPAAGYARMIDQVKGIKPTLVFLGYGNNEAFAGKAGIEPFLRQYEKLLDDLAKAAPGVRFVVLGPTRWEKQPAPLPDPAAANARFAEYGAALAALASRRGIPYVDFLKARDAAGAKSGGTASLTENGVNLSAAGYVQLGYVLARELGLPSKTPVIAISGEGKTIDGTRAHIEQKSVQPGHITFQAAIDSLYVPADDPASSPEQSGPKLQAEELSAGMWTLRVDGEVLARGTAEDWDARKITPRPGIHPDALQAEQLRKAIVAKNELYFHAWRPQNVTYLFGFRKHEQGQNAKDTIEFEKLVAEKEAEIARLKKPVPHKYELVRDK